MTQDSARDFFISYNKADRAWAEWIAWQLESEGYTTILQAWDFRPGTNFALQMDEAAKSAARTIAVLSPDYLENAPYSQAEWAAAFVQDPTGEKGTLLPIRVRACTISGLLKPIAYIDLVKLDETTARSTLLAGIRRTRAKPSVQPHFPGATSSAQPSGFPGDWPLAWNIPYGRNPFFTGREKLLTYLHDKLTAGNTMALTQAQAISGLGGIGKTQTAIEYAYRYQHQYRFVLWSSAATLETLLPDFVKLADLLQVPGRDPQNQPVTVAAIKNYLAQQRDWLLILDNADDVEMARDFLPIGNKTNGHSILTTRAQALGTVAHAVQVEEMDRQEGTLLLLRRAKLLAEDIPLEQAKAPDRTHAEAIVEAVGGLPLALDQIAAYIEETGSSLPDYLKLYQSRRQDLLRRRGRLVTDHPDTVATTWSLSFQKVEQENPVAADLLRLCAFLAPDAIPEEIISEGAPDLGKVLAPVAADPLRLNDAIEVLLKYSLVKRDAETKTLSMHRLVQVVLKDSMNRKVQRQYAERAVHAINRVFPYGWEVENWPQCRRLLSNAQVCKEMIEQYGLVFAGAARLLLWCGYYLYQQALYELAEPFFQISLGIAEKLDGTEHLSTTTTQHALGSLYQAQGKNEEAERLYKQALATSEKVRGAEHPSTAATQHQLATLYQTQGKYEEAERLYKQALTTHEKAWGAEHPSTAATQYALGNLYKKQGKNEEAELLYKQALTTYEKTLGAEHPSTATTQHQLATLYEEQGKNEEAELLYKQALTTYEKTLGAEHPHTSIALRNYASLLRTMNRNEEAAALEARIKKK